MSEDYLRLWELIEEAARLSPRKAPAVHIAWPMSLQQYHDQDYRRRFGLEAQDIRRRSGSRRPKRMSLKRQRVG